MEKKYYYSSDDNNAESLPNKQKPNRENGHMALAEVVKTRRKERGLTQEELATLAGISIGTVREIVSLFAHHLRYTPQESNPSTSQAHCRRWSNSDY